MKNFDEQDNYQVCYQIGDEEHKKLKKKAKIAKILGIASIIIPVVSIIFIKFMASIQIDVIRIILNIIFSTNDFSYGDSLNLADIGKFGIYLNAVVSAISLAMASALKETCIGKLSLKDENNVDIGLTCSIIGFVLTYVICFL